MTINKTPIAATLALLSLVEASAVFAATPVLEEVIVTAQKRTQDVQDVPIAITTIGSGDIERLNAATLTDIQYSTPNLTLSPDGRSNARMGIRGVSDYSRNPGYDNRVGVYVDGIYVGRSAAANQATLDLEQIEILRGPQGTLFGKNTVAGAIALTTVKPDGENSAAIKADFGTYNRRAITVKANGAIIKDKLFGKITVNNTQRDGHVKNLFNGESINGLDDQSIRAQLRWMGDKSEINVSIDHDERKAPFHGREVLLDAEKYAPNPYEVSFDEPQRQDIELLGASFIFDYEMDSGIQFSALTGYRESDFANNAEEDYTDSQTITNAYSRVTSSLSEKSDHLSQEFRWVSPENEQYDYAFGLYYFDQTNASASSAELLGGVAGVSVPATVNVRSYAAYAHGNYSITEHLQFTGGLRFTRESKDVDFTITDSTRLFTNANYQDSFTNTDVSPKAGLNYFITDDVMLYTNYSRGFKSGGWNVDFVSTLEQLAFGNESVAALEAGFKSTFWDGRARLNVAWFDASYDDFQVQQFVPLSNGGTTSTITNAGEVSSSGFEVDLNLALTESLTAWATYGYTDSVFDSFKNGGGIGVDYDGNALPDAPKTTYSMALEYRAPVSGGDVVVQVDYSYRDDFYTNPNNAEINAVDSYDIANVRIGYDAESWSIYAWSRNATDSDDIIYKSRSFLGLPRGTYMDPRMSGLTVSYNF